DITKIYVVFDIYSGTSCGSTAPTTTLGPFQVSDGTALNDGIGTASTTYSSSSETSYCVVARIVASSGGVSVNPWYTSGQAAEAAVLTFYNNTGQFVTGGGWITDPNGGHGKFGVNARYNKSGQPEGQWVYVDCGGYN